MRQISKYLTYSLVVLAGLTSTGCESTQSTRQPEPELVVIQPAYGEEISLFNGKTLDGWFKVGGGGTYRVNDGCIVGESGPGANTFLRTQNVFRDFELTVEVYLEIPINSGIQFRSRQREDTGVVYGYQCEIDPSPRAWSGGLYDESGRGWLQNLENKPNAQKAFNVDGWNTYVIRAVGAHIQTWVNGVPCVDLKDDGERVGFIALQVHSGDYGRIRWRNIKLRKIDAPPPHEQPKFHDGQ